jgi:hypothetical protein
MMNPPGTKKDGVAKTHQLLRCCNCSRHCGVPEYASFLDNCAPCIWCFLLSHSLFLLSCESIKKVLSGKPQFRPPCQMFFRLRPGRDIATETITLQLPTKSAAERREDNSKGENL